MTGASFFMVLTRPSLPVLMGVLLLVGPALMAWLISLQTIGQRETEDAYRGRVFGAIGTTTTLIMFFGSAIAGFMADQFGAFILISAAATIFMFAGGVSPMVFGDSIKIAPAQAEAQ